MSTLRTYAMLLRYYRRNAQFARHDYQNVFLKVCETFQTHGRVPIAEARILDVGCGQRFAASLLFHSSGARVVGIDTSVVDPKISWSTVVRTVRENGLDRAVKSLGRRVVFDRPYYRLLEREFGRPLRFDGLDLRKMDATAIAFPDASFDYVFSNAVFEHIQDVEGAVREIARVLVPSGVAHIGIHLFPSISGGHCLDWAYPDEAPSVRVPPWDHLRANRFPAHVYLNRLREVDYLSLFERYLTVEAVLPQYEGKAFLTHEVRSEIEGYSDDELLKRRVTVVIRKSEVASEAAAGTAAATTI